MFSIYKLQAELTKADAGIEIIGDSEEGKKLHNLRGEQLGQKEQLAQVQKDKQKAKRDAELTAEAIKKLKQKEAEESQWREHVNNISNGEGTRQKRSLMSLFQSR